MPCATTLIRVRVSRQDYRSPRANNTTATPVDLCERHPNIVTAFSVSILVPASQVVDSSHYTSQGFTDKFTQHFLTLRVSSSSVATTSQSRLHEDRRTQ